MPKFILVLFLFLISCSLKAQTWEVGVGAGAAGYMGDLNPNNPLKVSGPSASLFVKRNFDGYFSLRANFTYGEIAAADSNSKDAQFRQRNLSFNDKLLEGALMMEFNFFSYIPDAGKNKWTPYLYLGLAGVNYNPTTIFEGQTYNLRGAETNGEKTFSTLAISIPYGAGVKYNIDGKFTIGAEIGYRNPNTDYLDDVSGYYPSKAGLAPIQQALSDRSGEKTGVYIGTPGTQRGDLNPRDTYFFTQITFSYTFVTEKCYFLH
jgi:opacity protein-like surface antigen